MYIWKCYLENDNPFVSASMCWSSYFIDMILHVISYLLVHVTMRQEWTIRKIDFIKIIFCIKVIPMSRCRFVWSRHQMPSDWHLLAINSTLCVGLIFNPSQSKGMSLAVLFMVLGMACDFIMLGSLCVLAQITWYCVEQESDKCGKITKVELITDAGKISAVSIAVTHKLMDIVLGYIGRMKYIGRFLMWLLFSRKVFDFGLEALGCWKVLSLSNFFKKILIKSVYL